LFITFEGIEGCGKTTQIRRLEKRLNTLGIPLLCTMEPGGTKIGSTIRHILLDPHNKTLSPITELILYTADRAQHIEEVIKPALHQGKWVLCDRFIDATTAYQGAARGMDMRLIQTLNDTATQGIRPNITFLLHCPVEMGLERARQRNRETAQDHQGRFEQERMAFHRAVQKGYLELAAKEPKRFVVVDATLLEDVVEQEIWKSLTPSIR
jgi:dTMP kinase